MAFSTTSFHFPRSWTQVIQFLTLIWQMSCLTLSSHLYFGLPYDLLVRGFHLNIFLTEYITLYNFVATQQDGLCHIRFYSWPLKVGPKGCPETSVRNYYSLRNNPEEHSSHMLHGRSLKSCILKFGTRCVWAILCTVYAFIQDDPKVVTQKVSSNVSYCR